MGLDTKMTHYVAGQPFTAEMPEDSARVEAPQEGLRQGGRAAGVPQERRLQGAGRRDEACQKKDWNEPRIGNVLIAPPQVEVALPTAPTRSRASRSSTKSTPCRRSKDQNDGQRTPSRRPSTGAASGHLCGTAVSRRADLRTSPRRPVSRACRTSRIIRPDMLKAGPAGWRDGAEGRRRSRQELQLRHFGHGGFAGHGGTPGRLWKSVPSRQHPLRWIPSLLFGPSSDGTRFRLREPGLHQPPKARSSVTGRCSAWTRRTREGGSEARGPRSPTVRARLGAQDLTTSPSSRLIRRRRE